MNLRVAQIAARGDARTVLGEIDHQLHALLVAVVLGG